MKKRIKTLQPKYIIITSVILVVFLLSFYLFWFLSYQEKVYPGVFLGETALSGKNEKEVKDVVYQKITKLENSGITFVSEYNKEVKKDKSELLDSSLNHPFVAFFPDETIEKIFDSSKNKSFFRFLIHLFKSSAHKKIIAPIEIDKTGLNYFLATSFPELIIAPQNASFSLEKASKDSEEVLIINKEKVGKTINYDKVFIDLQNNLEKLNNVKISVNTLSSYPSFYEKDLLGLRSEAENILKNNRSLELLFINKENENASWKVKTEDIVSWLEIKKSNLINAVSLNEERISSYLNTYLVPEINKEILLPKFEMKNLKVSSWELGKNGQELNVEVSAKKISEAFSQEKNQVTLEVTTLSVESFVSENNFKIKEVIGTGESNFVGSSANRIHNIQTGVNTLHGLLIKPDEEFSLVKTLGEIDKEHGYRTELVIKDGKTIPEYGGGLCQIGTTVFRTALRSGLPITMRQNHSYRVSYYEPAGTDATIYDPWPDLRFINDTGNYILIQARIVNKNLYFDFWGISDGRVVELTDPVIYDIVKPPATKYIETEDLLPGQKHCTEGSHDGASAYFDYKVTYPKTASKEEGVKENRFNSHYVPWQGVCLIGKEKTIKNEITQEVPSTENNIPEEIKIEDKVE